MLEILVAMMIVSLGLVSLLSLEITNLRQTYSAYWRTIASVQAYSFLEVLRANESDDIRSNELQWWNQQNNHLLPKGIGDYLCQNEICTINLKWQEQTLQTFSLSSQLWK